MSTGGAAPPGSGAGNPESLERHGPVPLYLQVARQLSGEITSGALAPGSSLGTEPELMARFGVSRVTLRHAVDLVVAQGMATRRQGKGTYVTSTPLQYPLGELQGTTQVASAAGRPVHSTVTRYHPVRGSPTLRDSLELADPDQVWECWRVDHAADRPIAVAIINLPDSIGRSLRARDLEQTALYPLLEQRLRINTEVAHQTMQAEGAPAEIAELLDVAVGAPVMLVVRLARDVNNRPVEHSRTYFRADTMRFSIALYRNRAPDFSLPFSYEQHPGGQVNP